MSKQLTNDIVVIDSGSHDQTAAIVEHAGAQFIHQDWLGFAAQKQLAIDHAKHDWVLFLDADEVLSKDAVIEIHQLFESPTPDLAAAYSLPRQNWFQGKWIRFGSWWPDRVVRLVNRQRGQMKRVKVHECWQLKDNDSDKVEALENPIKHYSYENYSQLIQKADQYSTLAAKQMFADGRNSNGWQPLTHAIASFIRLFILKQGFRDGVEGAAIAYTTALASFMKYAKLQELQYNQQSIDTHE